jgi:hypothetical protein
MADYSKTKIIFNMHEDNIEIIHNKLRMRLKIIQIDLSILAL